MAKKINLVLYKPDLAYFNILNSYLEVIESLRWGLCELGYESVFMTGGFKHEVQL